MMSRIYDQQLSVIKDFFIRLQDLYHQESPPNQELLWGLKKIADITQKSNIIDVSTQTNEEIGLQNWSANGHRGRNHKEISQLKTIPQSTLNRAKALIQDITMRREELENDHMDTAKDIFNQVR